MITVMGATGNTGKKITQTLLKPGEKVRAVGRWEGKLAELKRAGANTTPTRLEGFADEWASAYQTM